MKTHKGLTYTVIICLIANAVGVSRVTGSVAVFLLLDASVGAIESFRDIPQYIIGLKLAIPRSIGCEIIVGDVLDQGIEPTTALKIIQRDCTIVRIWLTC